MNKNAFVLLLAVSTLSASIPAYSGGMNCHDMVTSREEEQALNRPFQAAESPQESLMNRFADLHREMTGESLGTAVQPTLYAQSGPETMKSDTRYPTFAQ